MGPAVWLLDRHPEVAIDLNDAKLMTLRHFRGPAAGARLTPDARSDRAGQAMKPGRGPALPPHASAHR